MRPDQGIEGARHQAQYISRQASTSETTDDDDVCLGSNFPVGRFPESGHSARTAWGYAAGLTEIARDLPNANDRHALDVAATKVMEMAF